MGLKDLNLSLEGLFWIPVHGHIVYFNQIATFHNLTSYNPHIGQLADISSYNIDLALSEAYTCLISYP